MENILLPNFDGVVWKYPTPTTKTIIKRQEDFIKEFYPSGHKIFDSKHYPDIKSVREILSIDPVKGSKSKTYEYHTHLVNRCAVTYQMDAVDIATAHLLGHKIQFDSLSAMGRSVKGKKVYSFFSEQVERKNFNTHIFDWIYDSMAVGHSAIYFFINEDGKTDCRVWSYVKGDKLYCSYDKKGNPKELYRKYSLAEFENGVEQERVYVDVVSASGLTTYTEGGEFVETSPSPFNFVPFVYIKRSEGAFWSLAQGSIDNHEIMLSRLSEDNRTKSKAKYVISGAKITERNGKKSANYQTDKIGDADFFIAGEGVSMSMIQGASLSEAFKYEYEIGRTGIFNTMGIVYPEHKSSGDMPTGSMKMLFFPTERKCKKLIHEYNKPIDQAASIFCKVLASEFPKENLSELSLTAYIKLFTPQDDSTLANIINQGLTSGAVAKSVARQTYPFVPSDNEMRCEAEEKDLEAKQATETPIVENVVVDKKTEEQNG